MDISCELNLSQQFHSPRKNMDVMVFDRIVFTHNKACYATGAMGACCIIKLLAVRSDMLAVTPAGWRCRARGNETYGGSWLTLCSWYLFFSASFFYIKGSLYGGDELLKG